MPSLVLHNKYTYGIFLYKAGLFLFAASLPLSKFTLSISQFILVAGWLITPDLPARFKKLFVHKIALGFIFFYLLFVAGLFWTTDFAYAWNDLRIKLPLIILPVICATMPKITIKETEQIIQTVIFFTLISTLISLGIYLNLTRVRIVDYRDISPFISHIRLSLLVCMSIFSVLYFISSRHTWFASLTGRWVWFLICLWFVYFLILIQSVTGLCIVIAGTGFIFCKLAVSELKIRNRWVFFIAFITLSIAGFYFIYLQVKPFLARGEVPEKIHGYTLNGRKYDLFQGDRFSENGHLFYLYNCPEELKEQWQLRSSLPYEGNDLRKQPLRFTLMRYLTSKGLSKDSLGIWQLKEKEIRYIENGIPNYLVPEMNNLQHRLYLISYELKSYLSGYNPSGHSLAMRLEFWKTGLSILSSNSLLGVGTGDVKIAFDQQYEISHSPLKKEFRHRAHNQYLTLAITFGLPLGALILYFMIRLLAIGRRNKLFLIFYCILLFSMLFEDTLETQSGISFAVFFSALFLIAGNNQHEEKES